MEGTPYQTKEEVLKKAQELIGIPLGEVDKTGRLSTGKGAVGTVIEESWFGYQPNSKSEPDFPEARVELKATPYIVSKKSAADGRNIRAKERLVCNIIDYMKEYQRTFRTSDFWNKCETMLILSYEYQKGRPKADITIDRAILFSFPTEDLVIIEEDWRKIIDKVRAGKAHLLTEGDTLYLAACTKGANASSMRPQPCSPIPAKQRAYSLKSSYMTRILNSYVFGNAEDEHIIKDWREIQQFGFEGAILSRLQSYYGKTQDELKSLFQLTSTAKNINEVLLAKMLGVKGKIAYTDEFLNASIVPNTIRIQKDGSIRESMSFPTFKFTEIVQETWEDSELRDYLEPTKFMFVIFQENQAGDSVFERVIFWNIPAEDLEEVRKVWEKTAEIIRQGVQLISDGRVIRNNLPKQKDNRVMHVRPHARNAADTYPLPDGRAMTKQCFWFNRTYVETIVKEGLRRNVGYGEVEELRRVAQVKDEYRNDTRNT